MMINMNVGGTERALLNMITEMSEEKYDITILMLEKYGDFLELIPERVNKKYLDEYSYMKDILTKPPRNIIVDLFKKRRFIKGLHFFYMYLISKVTKNKSIFFKYLLKNNPGITNEYDTAIAYACPMDFISYFVVHKINAKRKLQWIHFDVTKIGFNDVFASKLYHKFDQIYVVSQEGRRKLIERLPSLSGKIDTFLNVISSQKLLNMSKTGIGFTDQFNGIRILTVGRLSKEKGQDLVIPVMAELKKRGLNVKWYCIGDGSAKETYKEMIKEHAVKNEFILLGSQENPYPFMKQCDIYVQPSRHEGYCITLAEAKCFHKPILCTDFTGANEQISDGETGIVINFDEEEMVEALEKMINDVDIRNSLKNNLNKESMNNIKDKESNIAHII